MLERGVDRSGPPEVKRQLPEYKKQIPDFVFENRQAWFIDLVD